MGFAVFVGGLKGWTDPIGQQPSQDRNEAIDSERGKWRQLDLDEVLLSRRAHGTMKVTTTTSPPFASTCD
jgi:hypothetical protein